MSQDTKDLEDTAWTVEEIGQNLDAILTSTKSKNVSVLSQKVFTKNELKSNLIKSYNPGRL